MSNETPGVRAWAVIEDGAPVLSMISSDRVCAQWQCDHDGDLDDAAIVRAVHILTDEQMAGLLAERERAKRLHAIVKTVRAFFAGNSTLYHELCERIRTELED